MSDLQVGTIGFEDIDQYAASFAPAWDLEFRQMGAASGEGGCRFVTDGRSLVYQELYPATIGLRGTVGTGSMAFVLSNAAGRSGRWQGSGHPEDCIAYADDRKEVDVLLPESTGNLAAVVPLAEFRDLFERLAERPADAVFRGDRLFLRLDRDARARLERQLRKMMSSPPETGPLSVLIIEALVEAESGVQGHHVEDWPRVRRLFQRAVDFCQEGDGPSMSPGELAMRLGVSLRSLQLACKACAGIPPGCYLRRLRLNRAYVELSRSSREETTVGEVARDWGFTELGRFAVEYRRIFGEMPSDTLLRNQRIPRQFLPAIQ